ncbi:formimidoylglutamase [Flavobacterium sp.]|uniref:formimidoylglutamase n=1 Tax=Flavobacterium sp. TaxID=239 RepID=UPI003F698274
MKNLILFTNKHLAEDTNYRSGEVKLGEKVNLISNEGDLFEHIKNSESRFVVFGICEDIGVKANFGRQGTSSAFKSAIKSLLNVQHNKFCKGSSILLLGHLNYEKESAIASKLEVHSKEDRKALFKLVEEIDKDVSHLVSSIVKTGKIPIIIGGGHNNAYGNIKGLALGKGKIVNAINFDAHTDFRIMEGRHSGNGFTYAFEEHFLKKYFVFGLHEGYVSKSVFNTIKSIPETINYTTYEEIEVRKEKNFEVELENALQFIKNESFGIEMDLDAIAGVYSSAMTNSGFSVDKARQFVHYFGKHKNASYIHICEGAPDLDLTNNQHLTGKLIAYLITDFIKSKSE